MKRRDNDRLSQRTIDYLKGRRTPPASRGWRPLRESEVRRTEVLALPTTWRNL